MQSKEENALDNQYIFRHDSGSFSDVITYRKCLIDEIKKDANTMENHDIQNFSSKRVTDDKLEAFTEIAEAAGYTIYKVQKLQKNMETYLPRGGSVLPAANIIYC